MIKESTSAPAHPKIAWSSSPAIHTSQSVSFSIFLQDLVGQIFTMFILTVAAAEAAVGLAIIVIYYKNRGSINVEQISSLKG